MREVAERVDVGTAVVHLGGVRFPVSGPLRYTMTAEDAVELCGLLDPRTIVPIHYEGWKHFRQGRDAAERGLHRLAARGAGALARGGDADRDRGVSRAGRPTITTPEAWADAALQEIEHAGVRGLSAQAVARRLGVSKGGLYHHYADRRALLRAALALWEERHVTALTARFDAIADPRARLHELLEYAGVGIQPTVIVQLLAAADDPDVAAVLRRSTDERLALLRRIFRQLGARPTRSPSTARSRPTATSSGSRSCARRTRACWRSRRGCGRTWGSWRRVLGRRWRLIGSARRPVLPGGRT